MKKRLFSRFSREPKTHIANIGQVVVVKGRAYEIQPGRLVQLRVVGWDGGHPR
jgi:hypothetical protein